MPRSGLFAVVAALPLAAAVWLGGQEEGTPPGAETATREKIESLVGRLGSSERTDRVAAEQELLNYGPWVLPWLPASEKVPDPAARAALERVRRRLEENRAEAEVRASPVALHGRGTIAEVVGERFSTQMTGGSGLIFSREQAGRTIALDGAETPFWPMVDDLARQTGLWPDRVTANNQLSFRERRPEDETKRLAYAKAFRFAAGPVSVKPIAGEDGRRLVRLPLEVRAEPKLRPLFLSYSASDMTLTDAAGTAFPPFAPDAKQELPFADAAGAVETGLDWVAVAAVKGPLALKGKVRLTVAAEVVPFVGYFKEMGTADGGIVPVRRAETRGGVTVRFRVMTLHDDGTAEVEIAADYGEDAPVFESHRAWVYHKDAHLAHDVERNGEWTMARIDPESGFSVAESGGAVVLRYRFSGVPPQAQTVYFTYRAPTRIVEAPVEFIVDGLSLVGAP